MKTLAEIFNDKRIVALEEKIAKAQFDDRRVEDWLFRRQIILDKQFTLTEENKRLLSETNQILRQKLTEMHARVYELYEQTKSMVKEGEEFEVRGLCFADDILPALHPNPCERTENFFATLACSSRLYNRFGVQSVTLRLPSRDNTYDDSEGFLTLGSYDNWNEGLDREASKDMNLIFAMHYMNEAANFSWFDLMIMRNFYNVVDVSFTRR